MKPGKKKSKLSFLDWFFRRKKSPNPLTDSISGWPGPDTTTDHPADNNTSSNNHLSPSSTPVPRDKGADERDGGASAADHDVPTDSTAPPTSVQPNEAVLLWTEAYDQLQQADPDLVKAYEFILTQQSELHAILRDSSEVRPEPVNMFTGCTGPQRMEMMASAAQKVSEKTAKRADFLDGLLTAAQLLQSVASGVSKLVESYPPAAIALSGVASALPLLVKPITAQKAMASCLDHVLDRIEWYLSLSPVLLKDNWQHDSDFVHYRVTLRNAVLGLYKELLQLEMRCVCRFHNPHYLANTLKDFLSLVDWGADLEALKQLEEDLNNKVDKYNNAGVVKHLHSLTLNGSAMTRELKSTTSALQTLIAQNEQWRADQMQRHRDAVRKEQNELIGKFNTTPYISYMARNDYIVPGTCHWFSNHPKFLRWLDPESDPLLLVTAFPGCGKSTLAHYLIKTVLPEKCPDATVCHFFFKDGNAAQRKTANAMCALLHRLFDEQSERISVCLDEITKTGNALFSDTELLWQIFLNAATCEIDTTQSGKSSIICVLDALDECDPAELRTLLKRLRELLDTGTARVRFLVTTRPYPEIIQQIKVMDSGVLRLAGEDNAEMKQIQEEIALVMEHRLKELVMVKNLDQDTEGIIRKSLARKGFQTQRTYLWVKLVFEVLNDNFDDRPDEWEYLINNPPQTVFETYEKLLERVKDKDKPFVRLVISLVYVANPPLSLTEMNMAIECRNSIHAPRLPRLSSDEAFRTRIAHSCGFFITPYNDRLMFIHQTAREFLWAEEGGPPTLLDEIQTAPPLQAQRWQASVTRSLANRAMAESCIAYLSIGSIRSFEWGPEIPEQDKYEPEAMLRQNDQLRKALAIFRDKTRSPPEEGTDKAAEALKYHVQDHFPFLGYVLRHWTTHFRLAQVFDGAGLVADVGKKFAQPYLSLFRMTTPVCQTWAAITPGILTGSEFWGLRDIVDDPRYSLADIGPYIATACGHVRPLKEAHSRLWTFPSIPVCDTDNAGKRLVLSDIAKVLVGWAFAPGSEIALDFLLTTFPELSSWTGSFLRHACDGEDPVLSIIGLLLEKDGGDGVNQVHTRYGRYSTPLRAALLSFSQCDVQSDLVRLLLNHNADVMAGSRYGRTPLHNLVLFRRPNFEELLDIFIDSGLCAVDTLDDAGRSPLMVLCAHSIFGPHNAIRFTTAISILLEKGADHSLQDNGGYAPLHALAARCLSECVPTLVDAGADVEQRTNQGYTPLHVACMTFINYFFDGLRHHRWSKLGMTSPFYIWETDHSGRHLRVSELLDICTPCPGDDKQSVPGSPAINNDEVRLSSEPPSHTAGDAPERTLVRDIYEDVSKSPDLGLSQRSLAEEAHSLGDALLTITSRHTSSSQSVSQSNDLQHASTGNSSTLLPRESQTPQTHTNSAADTAAPLTASATRASPQGPHIIDKEEDFDQQPAGTRVTSSAGSTRTDDHHDEPDLLVPPAEPREGYTWSVDRADVLHTLVSAGAAVNVQDDEGYTSLHLAALAGDLFLVEVLLRDLGADVHILSHKGQTALHLACAGNTDRLYSADSLGGLGDARLDARECYQAKGLRRAVVGLLVDCGVDVDVLDQDGRTAADWAAYCGDLGMETFVRLRGDKAEEWTVVEWQDEDDEEDEERWMREDVEWGVEYQGDLRTACERFTESDDENDTSSGTLEIDVEAKSGD